MRRKAYESHVQCVCVRYFFSGEEISNFLEIFAGKSPDFLFQQFAKSFRDVLIVILGEEIEDV